MFFEEFERLLVQPRTVGEDADGPLRQNCAGECDQCGQILAQQSLSAGEKQIVRSAFHAMLKYFPPTGGRPVRPGQFREFMPYAITEWAAVIAPGRDLENQMFGQGAHFSAGGATSPATTVEVFSLSRLVVSAGTLIFCPIFK
ncbi:hypothetical protein SDC9_133960 [bioreactor metagenome]|uniref:Uncharacterized protein n=1 Tax=bioreactor metagenome TaxID=1076179 RepID=A0A645DCW1_9ZZZZ